MAGNAYHNNGLLLCQHGLHLQFPGLMVCQRSLCRRQLAVLVLQRTLPRTAKKLFLNTKLQQNSGCLTLTSHSVLYAMLLSCNSMALFATGV